MSNQFPMPLEIGEQTKKLFESGELGKAESKNPSQLKKMTLFYLVSFMADEDEKLTSANANNSVLAKNPSRS